MLRSLLTAVSALRNHQVYLDVVGNNIANVNTTGFKASRVSFQDLLSTTLRGGTAGDPAGSAGTNPMQVGMGMGLRGIDTIQTQGDLQPTGGATDVAIEGEGFFVLSDGRTRFYTRDGSFSVGPDGTLINPGGLRVQGWAADATGVVNPGGNITNISVPTGTIGGVPSSVVKLGGNLDASAVTATPAGTTQMAMTVFDSLGVGHNITVTFAKQAAANTWTWTAATTDTTVTLSGNTGTLAFTALGVSGVDPNAVLPVAVTTYTPQLTIALTNGATTPQNMRIDMRGLTQASQSSAVSVLSNDGGSAGQLVTITVDGIGRLVGAYSNGQTRTLSQLSMARFLNPSGLNKIGGNAYTESLASGTAVVGPAGAGGRGSIAAGTLEQSNVNLAEQFTRMILAERGFQANARVITTSDEVLQDLINLKR